MLKTFFLISNFLAKNRNNIVVITLSNKSKKLLSKNIKFISFDINFWKKLVKDLNLFKPIFTHKRSINKQKFIGSKFSSERILRTLIKIFGI